MALNNKQKCQLKLGLFDAAQGGLTRLGLDNDYYTDDSWEYLASTITGVSDNLNIRLTEKHLNLIAAEMAESIANRHTAPENKAYFVELGRRLKLKADNTLGFFSAEPIEEPDFTPGDGGGQTGPALAGINVQDEGVTVGQLATALNFEGEGVEVTGEGPTKTVSINGIDFQSSRTLTLTPTGDPARNIALPADYLTYEILFLNWVESGIDSEYSITTGDLPTSGTRTYRSGGRARLNWDAIGRTITLTGVSAASAFRPATMFDLVGPRGPVGPAGQDGQDGADGRDGTDGQTIYYGTWVGGTPYPQGARVLYNGAFEDCLEANADQNFDPNKWIPARGGPGVPGKDGAPGEPGRDGRDGEPGLNGTDGRPGTPGRDGRDGQDGQDGQDGKEGPPGRDGRDGTNGVDGSPGTDGQDGQDGAPGRDGRDGAPGTDGQDGADGADGRDCYLGAWVANADNKVGDRREYQGAFYDCKTANTDATFDPEKWIPARGATGAAGKDGADGTGTTVTANPADAATDELEKVTIDGTVYSLAGGTEVVANPTEDATDELTKLNVDGTVYSIPNDVVKANSASVDTLGKIAIDDHGTLFTTLERTHPATAPSWTDTVYTNSKFQGVRSTTPDPESRAVGDWYANAITLQPRIVVQRAGYKDWDTTTWATVGITTFRGGATSAAHMGERITANGDLWLDTNNYRLYVVSDFVAGTAGSSPTYDAIHFADAEKVSEVIKLEREDRVAGDGWVQITIEGDDNAAANLALTNFLTDQATRKSAAAIYINHESVLSGAHAYDLGDLVVFPPNSNDGFVLGNFVNYARGGFGFLFSQVGSEADLNRIADAQKTDAHGEFVEVEKEFRYTPNGATYKVKDVLWMPPYMSSRLGIKRLFNLGLSITPEQAAQIETNKATSETNKDNIAALADRTTANERAEATDIHIYPNFTVDEDKARNINAVIQHPANTWQGATKVIIWVQGQPLAAQAYRATDTSSVITTQITQSVIDALRNNGNLDSTDDFIETDVVLQKADDEEVYRRRIYAPVEAAPGPTETEVDAKIKAHQDNANAHRNPLLLVQTLTSAAALAWDTTKGHSALVTLGHNATLTITGGAAGQSALLTVTQDATGSRTLSLGTIPRFDNVDAPTLKTAANSVNLLMFVNIAGTWNFVGVK